MDLWSKGLGRLVLQLRLAERASMADEESELVMRGTMGKPTFWDWSVHLEPKDVVDFLIFLKRPEVIRFMIESPDRWLMLRTALAGAVLFGARAVRGAVLPCGATASDRASDLAGTTETATLKEKS